MSDSFSIRDILQPSILGPLLLSYLLLVRLLRYQNVGNSSSTRPVGALSDMTVAEAQKIVLKLSSVEFPTIYRLASQFALFRTYGIPTISKLLLDTSLLSDYSTASKRYTDTEVLIAEFLLRDIGSAPWVQGIARLNCIHGKYVQSGRISNDDLLYTLGLFLREPVRFVDRYEWRQVSNVEKGAIGIFWKTIGDAMLIDMSVLPTRQKKENWRDGLHFFEELSQWAEDYEAVHMVPSEYNAKVATQTTNILLWNVPAKWKPLGHEIVSVMMDTRLRKAMDVADPPAYLSRRVFRFIEFRRFCLRHLALPRPWIFRYQNVSNERSTQGTFSLSKYDSLPYYVKPSFWNRWGPGALVRRVRGLPIPGDDGDKYCPGGYRTVDVGPPHGKLGQTEYEKKAEDVGQRRCPMAFG